ncbi:MAG: primosomal protein N' [Burkholderiales bacterium]|nr:primosomal protein N' [Burkholderiales bacterium]
MTFVRVAIDVPVHGLFDYRVEDGEVRPGQRVAAPFGVRTLVGVVVETGVEPAVAPSRVRLARRLDDIPALPPTWLELMRFCASYYQHPPGAAFCAALPAMAKSARPVSHMLWSRVALQPGYPQPAKRERTRRALIEALAAAPRFGCDLAAISPKAMDILEEWQGAGIVAEAPRAALEVGPAPPLTDEQSQAAHRIAGSLAPPRFGAYLLHGVTGSGKTEVYLDAIARVLAAGRQALVLVPEINLTPRLKTLFETRFPSSRIVMLHSSLSESERLHQWLLAHTGGADVVLGTRMAALAPLARPGLIVVDEEHDASFKQQEGMRYSARDIAVYRARLEQVPVILGSATPSLESFAHATSGRYERLRLLRRAVTDAVLPTIRLLDLTTAPQNHGVATTIWSEIALRLERGEQSLLFLNRRGYAPVLSCASCGWVSACSRCTAYLVMHRARGQTEGGTLRCHHCGHAEAVPARCPTCGNVDIRGYGQGTQRLEARLAEAYPGARVLRVDRDSTSRKGSAEALLDQVHAGEADILVGTQMLAKGHDFKNLTLVAALNVDAALLSADFRASERLFAQLTQVAGRAGRADKPGLVLIQTRQSGHPLFQALLSGDYDRFATRLLAEREAAGLPPAGYQAMLRAEARGLDAALGFLASAAEAAPPMGQGVTVYDPVPMLITRLKDVERAQLMVESPSRPHLQAFLTRWVDWLSAHAPSSVRWHVEVDPLVI